MLYTRDDDFDVEQWRQEVTAASSKSRIKAQRLKELLARERQYEKKQIVALLMDETGVSKARAYEVVDEGKAAGILRFNKTIKSYALA